MLSRGYWKWAAREDIVSNDSYPDPADSRSGMRAALAGDLMRSLGRGRPWILMEQTANRVNWRDVNVAKEPGQMRLWSYQALARGADGVMFFQWRQSRAGAEKHHSAMVPHGPLDVSPTWNEVVTLGRELAGLDAVCGSQSQADVAMLFDWESWWALELPSKPSNRIHQMEQVEAYYQALFDANVTVDLARPGDDLSRYRLVLAPNLYLVSDEAAASLAGFVEAGGTLVMSFFSGIVDPAEHIRLGGYPKPFQDLLGIHVIDFHPLSYERDIGLRLADGPLARGEVWSEDIRLHGAEVVATFSTSHLAGRPAITRHRAGQGTAFYLGTRPDPKTMARVLEMEIADYEVLFDIPRPEKWEMDVWVTFGANPPVGMEELVPWVQATGLQPDDLARYEQHQRRIRVVAAERLRALLRGRLDDLLLPALETLVVME